MEPEIEENSIISQKRFHEHYSGMHTVIKATAISEL